MEHEKESLLGDYDTVLNDLESSYRDLASAVRSIQIYEVGSQHLQTVTDLRNALRQVIDSLQSEYDSQL